MMNILCSPLIRLRHVMWTRSVAISLGLVLLALFSPVEFFLPAILLAVITAAYFSISGRLIFESNRNYVWWLAKTVTQRTTRDPHGLVLDLCRKGSLSDISSIRTAELAHWYSP